MQVTSNPISEKQTGLERQVRSKEIPATNSATINSHKFDEQVAEKGDAKNETSQYLKVLSRLENLLVQNKLPDAAIDGFAGAIKKQIDAMTEADRQMLMKIPELKMLELENLDDIPEMIKNDIRNEDKNSILLKFLKVTEFADLMRTDKKPTPMTYTAKSVMQPLPAENEGEVQFQPASDKSNLVQSSSAKEMNQNISQKVKIPTTNRSL